MRKVEWIIKCPLCGSMFESYEEFVKHVFESHPNNPAARVRAITQQHKR
ncbi:MAG: hypothetical protein NXY59_06565 [Aigarchaeota archaeon]|nr:hypothetical protein [Candidatus Pelearchaeum maunauluense]